MSAAAAHDATAIEFRGQHFRAVPHDTCEGCAFDGSKDCFAMRDEVGAKCAGSSRRGPAVIWILSSEAAE